MSEIELRTTTSAPARRRPIGALGEALGEWLHGLSTYGLIAAAIWIPYQAAQLVLALALGVPAAGAAVQAAVIKGELKDVVLVVQNHLLQVLALRRRGPRQLLRLRRRAASAPRS